MFAVLEGGGRALCRLLGCGLPCSREQRTGQWMQRRQTGSYRTPLSQPHPPFEHALTHLSVNRPTLTQHASLVRNACAHAPHVQEGVQAVGNDPFDYLPPRLQGRRHRRHQGELGPAEGYASQVLPRVRPCPCSPSFPRLSCRLLTNLFATTPLSTLRPRSRPFDLSSPDLAPSPPRT